ncbi:seminal metalloprotease 1-like [Sabethes cyaneus]|uniref:seminal metalloprotease 1-like n=1 Tax=Sabethes cyaneus TaxID=53552 RepID=UPI00237EC95A|nr:seminal metalloprotease 1-like [Sabethes cyaneus]
MNNYSMLNPKIFMSFMVLEGLSAIDNLTNSFKKMIALQLLVIFTFVFYCNGAPSLRISENSAENIARLSNLRPGDLAEELSGQFEGDMILTEEQYAEINRKNGMLAEKYRWPSNTLVYEIEEGWYDNEQIDYIHQAMRIIEHATCLQFKQRDALSDSSYISIHGDSTGCSATVGHNGESQHVKLKPYPVGSGCFRLGTIVHELIHAIGFRHMQNTYNRDDYVEIMWENIEPGKEKNFYLYGPDKVDNFGEEYDYGSIMHYSEKSFSMNGEKTIVVRQETDQKIGQRDGMSKSDILKINRMYGC